MVKENLLHHMIKINLIFYNYGVDLLLRYMINLKDCSGSDFEIIEEDSEDNPFLYFG